MPERLLAVGVSDSRRTQAGEESGSSPRRPWSAARERLTGFLAELIEDGPVVAEPDCVLSAGMEMAGGFRLLRDGSVLLLDFIAELLHVDKIKDVCHRVLSREPYWMLRPAGDRSENRSSSLPYL